MAAKRRLWQEDAMKEAVAFIESGSSLRHVAKLYKVPVETKEAIQWDGDSRLQTWTVCCPHYGRGAMSC